MDWNVNWHIYHRVESKLFTRDMVTGCPGLPGAPSAAPRGHRQSSSCGVSVTTSCLSAAAPWRGFPAPATEKEKLKTTRHEYWNARKTCVLLRWRKKINDECDGGIWPTDAVQLCRAGSLRINQLGGMKTLLLILFTTSLLFLQMLQMC